MDTVQDRTASYEVNSGSENSGQHLQPFDDFMEYLRDYARERPEVTIFTCLAVGFILGWKLKPW